MSSTPEPPKRDAAKKPSTETNPKPEKGSERDEKPIDPAAYAALTAPMSRDVDDPLASFAKLGDQISTPTPTPQGTIPTTAPRRSTAETPPNDPAPMVEMPTVEPMTSDPLPSDPAPMFTDDAFVSDTPPADVETVPIYRVSARAERSERRKQTAARLRGGTIGGSSSRPQTYASRSDPTFGYLVGMALTVGLTPILPYNADLRLVIAWGVLAGIGVLAWLVGNTERIGEEAPENLVWGVVFGLILAAPLLLAGGDALTTTVRRIFYTGIEGELRSMSPGMVLALVVFVMPLAETLFFRGLMQQQRPFWLVGAAGSLWSILLFFPMIEVGRYPAIAVIIGTALTLMNLIYSYVRARNGLASAWLCQITINILLMFIPYVTG